MSATAAAILILGTACAAFLLAIGIGMIMDEQAEVARKLESASRPERRYTSARK